MTVSWFFRFDDNRINRERDVILREMEEVK